MPYSSEKNRRRRTAVQGSTAGKGGLSGEVEVGPPSPTGEREVTDSRRSEVRPGAGGADGPVRGGGGPAGKQLTHVSDKEGKG
jgi:hypothetical protein